MANRNINMKEGECVEMVSLLETWILLGRTSEVLAERCDLFQQQEEGTEEGPDVDLARKLLDGKYEEVLLQPTSQKIFGGHKNKTAGKSLESVFQVTIEDYLNDGNILHQFHVLAVGISCLQLFVRCNWTGPSASFSPFDLLPTLRDGRSEEDITDEVMTAAVMDGETVYPVLKHPEYLFVAEIILENCLDKLQLCQSSNWWCLRCLFIHQYILEEKSPQLHFRLTQLIDICLKLEPLVVKDENWSLKAQLLLEAGYIHAFYFEVLKSKEYFLSAQKTANLDVLLIGALGKRTRYQVNNLPQLTVKIDKEQDEDSKKETQWSHNQVLTSIDHLPKDLKLDDDVVLNRVQFQNGDMKIPDLSPVEQVVLLGIFLQTQKSQPKDNLLNEELMPYLTCLLSQPKIWCVQMVSLLARSKLESNQRRTVERAMMQTQVLMDSVRNEYPTALERLQFFYCSGLPAQWNLERELANLLLSLNAFNSALDIYMRLQMWEDVIACYHRLELRHKAEKIVRQELSKKETPKMWCLLGDATDDPTYYETAWELSNHKSARAQRSWGYLYYYKKKYAECIPHFQESLKINPIQLPVWIRLGYAAMEQEDWTLAASAYRRYCSLEPDNFEAWNNLSKCYVKLGQKYRAWKTLQESVKCRYDNWKIWDNYMVVSTDCGAFTEVIRAYNRILDLKEKHVDTEVLAILIKAIIEDLPDNEGNPAHLLQKKALTLMGRLTAQVATNAQLWQLYAELTSSITDQTEITHQKISQYLQKAHRCAVQKNGWEKEYTSCKEVMELGVKLSNSYLACAQKCVTSDQGVQMLASAKLALKGIISRVKQQHTDIHTGKVKEELSELLQALEENLEKVTSEIAELQGT